MNMSIGLEPNAESSALRDMGHFQCARGATRRRPTTSAKPSCRRARDEGNWVPVERPPAVCRQPN